MSLIDFIQKIQKKPRYLRLQILWLAVFVSMISIVSLWVVSLKSSLPETAEEIKEPLEKLGKEVPSLKEAFKASIGAFFEKDLEEEFEKLESQEENIEQAPKEQTKIKPVKLPISQ